METPKEAARRLTGACIRGDFTPEALHPYTDVNGQPSHWKMRARLPNGEKWIRPMRRNGDGYELSEPEFPNGKPLYGLHQLATKPDAPVWYVEGEKCADWLAGLGLLATTAGSATSDEQADFSPLAGRTVTIWPDSDAAGKAHADRVAEKLRALGCVVELIDVQVLALPDGGDCVDWMVAHERATTADLAALPRVRAVHAETADLDDGIATTWPQPLDEAAYYGLAGDVVRLIEPHTESDPAAILLQVLVAFGALVGRGPYYRVEGDEHHGNLFALLAGDTAKARKGTSWGRVLDIFRRVKGWPSVVTGLSTGEGLKYRVRDGSDGDGGVADKRLLVVESEFAQVLRQTDRAGNTLSAVIRSAWDTGYLATLTRNDPVTATGAHISIIGHITINELAAELTATDSANGFANRFIFMCVTRSKLLPFGGEALSDNELGALAFRIEGAADKARGLTAVKMTAAARELWELVYATLSEGSLGLVGAVTARAEAQCVRLALLYALMSGASAIDRAHLLAAIAVWERAAASARFIWGAALGDVVADEILPALRAARPGGMTRTEIRDLFKRHGKAERIGAALELLQRRGLAVRGDSKPEGGRPAELWKAT